ncbi:MAG: outer membrane lipoprotein-sorting protein [Spirochaetota bacterium]
MTFRLAIVLLLTTAATAFVQEPDEIIRDAALFGRFESLVARIRMEIHDGGTKHRTLELHSEQDDDGARAFVQIISPAFLNRMKFLTISARGATDQWIGTSRGVRRLADGSRDERLFDSDFRIDDFTPPEPDEYDLTRLDDRVVDGEPCYVVDIVPRTVRTDYARRRVFVAREDRLLVRAEYYSPDDELVRLFRLEERTYEEGTAFPARGSMRSISDGTETVLTVEQYRVGVTIPDRMFSRGNL